MGIGPGSHAACSGQRAIVAKLLRSRVRSGRRTDLRGRVSHVFTCWQGTRVVHGGLEQGQVVAQHVFQGGLATIDHPLGGNARAGTHQTAGQDAVVEPVLTQVGEHLLHEAGDQVGEVLRRLVGDSGHALADGGRIHQGHAGAAGVVTHEGQEGAQGGFRELFGLGLALRQRQDGGLHQLPVDRDVDSTKQRLHAVEGLVEVTRGQLRLPAHVTHGRMVVALVAKDHQPGLDQLDLPLALTLLRVHPAIAPACSPRSGGGRRVFPIFGNSHCQIVFLKLIVVK